MRAICWKKCLAQWTECSHAASFCVTFWPCERERRPAAVTICNSHISPWCRVTSLCQEPYHTVSNFQPGWMKTTSACIAHAQHGDGHHISVRLECSHSHWAFGVAEKWHFPLKAFIALTTVLRYRADCDVSYATAIGQIIKSQNPGILYVFPTIHRKLWLTTEWWIDGQNCCSTACRCVTNVVHWCQWRMHFVGSVMDTSWQPGNHSTFKSANGRRQWTPK